MSGLTAVQKVRKKIAQAVAKQAARLHNTQGDSRVRNRGDLNPDTATMNVEGVSGMKDPVTGDKTHFPIDDPLMPFGDQARFNRAHQTLLQNDDGSPIFESMGLLFDRDASRPQKQGMGPGMWFDKSTGKSVRSPTTEYEFQKTEPWRQNLAGDYAMGVMGQDGVPISDMTPGLPRGKGYVSVVSPAGSDVEGSLANLHRLTKREGDGAGKLLSLENENMYSAPGSKGNVIGSLDEISPAEATDWKRAIGQGAEMYHRKGGGDAYRAAEGWSYTSVADNLGKVKDSFLNKGMADEFDNMLRQTAKQSVDAYRRMGNISRSNANPNFGIVWEHINTRPKEKPHVILQELIDKKIISMEEMNAIMQQFAPQQSQQPQGLLA